MHVLIVEDDPIVADVLGMTLEEARHFKTMANTIKTALSELKHNRIDAILLDLNLPDGDGTRLARLEIVCVKWACQRPPNHGRKGLVLLSAFCEKNPRKSAVALFQPW